MNCSVVPWIASKMDSTLEERVFLVECYFREGKYTAGVKEQFSKKCPETAVRNRHTVRALIEKFQDTGFICDIKRSGPPSVLTEDKLLSISDSMMQSPSKSVRKLPQHHIALVTAHVAVRKKLNLFPYKVTAV
jgi:transposase